MDAILAVAGLAAGIPGAIDVLIKACNYLAVKTQDYKDTLSSLEEIQARDIENVSSQLVAHLESAKVVVGYPEVSESLKAYLGKCLSDIKDRLVKTDYLLERYKKRPFKYAWLGGKKEILKLVQDLRRLGQDVDTALNGIWRHQKMVPSRLFLSASQFQIIGGENDKTLGAPLPHSEIFLREGYLAKCDHADGILGLGTFILERMVYADGGQDTADEAARFLASKLYKAEISNGIPRFIGYRHVPSRNSHELVFSIPPSGGTPHTLHDLLLYKNPAVRPPSLTARLDYCHQLAKAVLFTYDIQLVHKNIRPQNILVLSPEDDRNNTQTIRSLPLGTLFLTNWKSSRNAADATTLVGSKDWQHGIYQHPQRQGNRAGAAYVIGHDIYSLGVCMLEILLWKSFVDESDSDGVAKINQLYQERAIHLGIVMQDFIGNTEAMVKIPSRVQKVLVDIARTELPAAAGDKMTELVLNCLTCLENSFKGHFVIHGEEEEDKDIRLRYILDVLSAFSV